MATKKKPTHPLLVALDAIRGTGRFHSAGTLPFTFPGIALPDGQQLAFPLPPAQADAVKAVAEPAPYGKGAETVRDESVRKCWQLDAAELAWTSPDWQTTLATIVKAVAKDLGVPGTVNAEPYKLLLYEQGGHFLPHRDTEKLGAMFATLIVALPSAHTGGTLLVRHAGQEQSVDFSSEENLLKIQYAAFFADCEHEVQPVTSGHRLCLAYNLALKKGSSDNLNASTAKHAETLVPHLLTLANDCPKDLTAIPLEHQYTEANVSFRTLKGHDRSRAAALLAAASSTGFNAHLAILSLYRMGELEGGWDDYYDGYRSRRPSSASEETMGEVYEETLSLDDWRDPGDRSVQLGAYNIDDDCVLSVNPVDYGDPHQEESEGYTGNAGCTMEYWYHHAAVVLWPRAGHESILTKYNFAGACTQLNALASRKGAATHPGFLALGHAAIDTAEIKIASKETHARTFAARQALPVLDAITTARSAELLTACQKSLLPLLLSVSDQERWHGLITAFGPEAIAPVLTPGDSTSPALAPDAIFAVTAALLSTKDTPETLLAPLAKKLPDLIASSKKNPSFRHPQTNALAPEQRLHIAIAASHALPNGPARDQLRTLALADHSLTHIRETLAPALTDKNLRHHFSQKQSLHPELKEIAVATLQQEISQPIEPYPDWTRPFPEQSPGLGRFIVRRLSTDLAAELKKFILDPAAETHPFKRTQQDRDALADHIKAKQLDLDLQTEKKGSPHTLICTKNHHSYHRALKQRTKDQALLSTLTKS